MRTRVVLPALLLVAVVAGILLLRAEDGPAVGFTPQVFVVRSDGSGLRQVTDGGGQKSGPSWSRDGRRLAYANNGIKVVTVSSGRVRTARGVPPSRFVAAVAWSPRRDELVYRFSSGTEDRPRWNIATLQPDGKRLHRIASWTGTVPPHGDPVWSPDGNWVAYIRERKRRGPPPSGPVVAEGGPTNVAVVSRDRNRQRSFEVSGNEHSPVWSPDGKAILFERNGKGLWKVSQRGRGPQQVGAGVTTALGGTTWSPDSRQVAFAGHVAGPDRQQHLYLVDARADAKPRKIVAEVNAAAWSPASELIAFADFKGRLAVTTPTGTQRTLAQFAADTDMSRLNWSRDGRWLAFVAERRRPD